MIWNKLTISRGTSLMYKHSRDLVILPLWIDSPTFVLVPRRYWSHHMRMKTSKCCNKKIQFQHDHPHKLQNVSDALTLVWRMCQYPICDKIEYFMLIWKRLCQLRHFINVKHSSEISILCMCMDFPNFMMIEMITRSWSSQYRWMKTSEGYKDFAALNCPSS